MGKKRIFGFLLSFLMVVTLVPASAFTVFADGDEEGPPAAGGIFFEPEDGRDEVFNDNENKIIKLDLTYLNEQGLVEDIDYSLDLRIGNYVWLDEEEKEVFVDVSEKVPGSVVKTKTDYGYELKMNGRLLFYYYEEGIGNGWTRFEAFVNRIPATGDESDLISRSEFFMPVREAIADYEYERDRDMLPNWDGSVNSDYNVYVEDTDHPDGEDIRYFVTNVEKIKDEPWNSEDGDVVVDFHRDEDNEGHYWWYYRVQNYGDAAFEVTYTDLNGEEKSYTFDIHVRADVYEVSIFSETGSNMALPGETMDLYAFARHESEEDNSTEGVIYEWSLNDYGSQFAQIEAVENEPWHARVTFNTLPEDREWIGEWFEAYVVIYDGTDDEGNPLERARSNFWMGVLSDYFQIFPAFMEGGLPLGRSYTDTWEVRSYSLGEDGYRIMENVDFWWFYDSNKVEIRDGSGNIVGNNEEVPYKGSQCEFTITRLSREDTEINLYVFWEDENGNEQREEIRYWLYWLNYDIWPDEHDIDVYSDDFETSQIRFNIEQLGENHAENFDIDVKAGYWGDEEWNDLLVKDKDYTVSEEDGRLIVALSDSFYENIKEETHIRVTMDVYMKDTDHTDENRLSEADGWFHIQKACETHNWYEKVIKAATCTDAGTVNKKCGNCGEERLEEIPAKGHVPGSAVKENEVAATCTADGSYDEVVYCTVCENEISRVKKTVAKFGHKMVKVAAKAASLTAAGNTEYYKCSVCGKLFKDSGAKTAVTIDAVTIPKLIDINTAAITGIGSKTYTGKAISPEPKVAVGSAVLKKNTDYTVAYKNNTKSGKASVIITGIGKYAGSVTKTFTINKAKNTFAKVTASKKISYSKLKKKNQTFTIAATVKEKAKKTYKLSSVPKAAKKYITVSKTGKVTVKKGLKKGTYSIKVKITAAATANYKKTTSAAKTIKITVK